MCCVTSLQHRNKQSDDQISCKQIIEAAVMISTLFVLLTYWRCQKIVYVAFHCFRSTRDVCVCHMCEGVSHTETPLLVTAQAREIHLRSLVTLQLLLSANKVGNTSTSFSSSVSKHIQVENALFSAPIFITHLRFVMGARCMEPTLS